MTTNNSRLTWLHLSDIHVGHGDAQHGHDQELVLNELKNDVRGAAERGVPAPDAIFVTGDLAFSGNVRSKTEYKRVAAWLSEIAGSLSVPAERIFVVPGNHDVQRNVEEKDPAAAEMLKELRAGRLKVDNVLANKEKRAVLAARMSNYLKFAKDFAPANCFPKPWRADLFWSHRLKVSDGLVLHLVGLNTSLLAAKEEDEYGDFMRLQLGTGQVANAFSSSSSDSREELNVVLSHHPFNWLRDGGEVAAAVKKYAHVHLCGHVHNAASARERSGSGQDIVKVIAGAAHEDAGPAGTVYRHGYSFGSVWARDDGRLMLRIWPRLWSKNFEFRVDKDSLPPTNKRGRSYRDDFVDHELRLKVVAPPVAKGKAAKKSAKASKARTAGGGAAGVRPAEDAQGLRPVKCQALKDQRDLLIEQYGQVAAAALYSVSPADKVLLKRQLAALEAELVRVEEEIEEVCP